MHMRTREAPVYLVDAPVKARHLGVKVCVLLGVHRTRLSLSHLLSDPPVSDPLENVGARSIMGAISAARRPPPGLPSDEALAAAADAA